MRIIGVTGPSGSGKGEASRILAEYGFLHIDADAVYHDLLIPPSPCLDEIVKNFGGAVLNDDGTLNRKYLGKIVFSPENKEKLLLLNSITHKFVCEDIREYISKYENAYIIDAPLLIESGLDGDCDIVIAVLANEDVRADRIAMRDGISVEDAKKRISAQKPDSFYVEHSTYAIYNNSNTDNLRARIRDILVAENFGGEL